PVGQLEPALLPQRVQRVDDVVRAPLPLEVLVELEVEPDGDPLRVGPAALLRALDEQLVRPELLPGRPDAPLPQLLELVRLERRPHLAEPRPELRAEHGEVR